MENCSKCKSSHVSATNRYKYHDTYDCLCCGNWWHRRIETCCRKQFLIVTQCHKFSPNTRLYEECTHCGGCMNRNTPLSFKKYSHEIEGPFYDVYFEEWKREYQEEGRLLFEAKANFNYLNSKYFKYKNYLLSVEWKEKRWLVLERDNSLCQHCKTATAENIHHLKYDNLFNEPLEDLLSLCMPCHEKEHQSPID